MKQYHVTGMSCAACSARVEKAVSNVPGVTACSVSLLTNSMGVEGTAADQAIIDAVQAAGYGASVKGAQQSANPAAGADALAEAFAAFCAQAGFAPQCIAAAASIDLKQNEAGLLAFCQSRGWPVEFFTAEQLRLRWEKP